MRDTDKLMLAFLAGVRYDQPANDWRKTPATAEDPDDDSTEEVGLRQQVKKALSLEKVFDPNQRRDKDGQWTKGGPTKAKGKPLLHGTTIAKAKQILEEGLKIEQAQAWNFVDRTNEWKPAIWTTANAGIAKLFGRERSKGKKFAVVVIKPMKGDGGNKDLGYVTFAKDIPANQIVRVDIYDPAEWPDSFLNRAFLSRAKPVQTLTKSAEAGDYLYVAIPLDDEPLEKTWAEALHPRQPAGSERGGEFAARPGAATSPSGGFKFGREFNGAVDGKAWFTALDGMTGVDAQYRKFLEGVVEAVMEANKASDEDDLLEDESDREYPLVLRDATNKVQALAQYRIKRGRKALQTRNDLDDLLEEGDLPPGRYLILDKIAVAPWQHPSQPGRQKGMGTKLFMRLVRKMVDNKLTGLVLVSKSPESDKFYDALGLEAFTIHENGQTGQAYSLTREDGRELYEQYQARLRRGGGR